MLAHILVVDDDTSTREAIGLVLEDEGYQVRTAANGREALEVVRSAELSMVVTDLHMPYVGGMELLREVRLILPRVPVLIITADGESHAAAQAGALLADGYLLKPLDLDDMLARVARLL